MVGSAGFEPTTFRPPDGRATKLRYDPYQYFIKIDLILFKVEYNSLNSFERSE